MWVGLVQSAEGPDRTKGGGRIRPVFWLFSITRQKVVIRLGDGFAPLMDDINPAGTCRVPPPLLLAPLAGETQAGLLPLQLPDAAGETPGCERGLCLPSRHAVCPLLTLPAF